MNGAAIKVTAISISGDCNFAAVVSNVAAVNKVADIELIDSKWRAYIDLNFKSKVQSIYLAPLCSLRSPRSALFTSFTSLRL